jgi:hypothetical protein
VDAARTIDFGSHYFGHGCGIPYERNDHWLGFFDGVAEGIVRDLQPSTVLDAGCAMGFLVEQLRKRGVEAWGVDVSEYAVAQVEDPVAAYCEVASLTRPLERRYDLIVCVEVLEHIPAKESDLVISNLCAATDRLLLSTSPADYREASHVNVQPPEAWSAALAREGFLRDLDRDFSYLTPWAALYTRVEEPASETVRRYDRSWWRLRHEVSEVRSSLLEAESRLAEIEGDSDENSAETKQELDRRGEEILRLRDLLIGKDAELGAARGRLTELEDHSLRLANAAGRLPSRIPGGRRVAAAVLRRLQGRRGQAGG